MRALILRYGAFRPLLSMRKQVFGQSFIPRQSCIVPQIIPFVACAIRLQTSPPRKSTNMSFYDASVPAFLQILGSLSGILNKAETHCAAKNIQPDVLLSARLYPDMLPLSKQIQ